MTKFDFLKIVAIFYKRRSIYCLKFQYFERICKNDLNNTKLMLQFWRNRLKVEQNCGTPSLILVQNYWNLWNSIIEILVLVSSSILTPNTRSLSLMILHLKPKVVNVLAKLGLLKPIFNKKSSIFSLSRMPSLTFYTNIT